MQIDNNIRVKIAREKSDAFRDFLWSQGRSLYYYGSEGPNEIWEISTAGYPLREVIELLESLETEN